VHALDGKTLTVAFVNGGSRESFARNGCDEVLRQVLIDVLGVDWRVECIVDPSATPADQPSSSSVSSPSTSARPAAAPAPAPAVPPADSEAHPDDSEAEGGDTHELLTRELGAQVIEEIPNQP